MCDASVLGASASADFPIVEDAAAGAGGFDGGVDGGSTGGAAVRGSRPGPGPGGTSDESTLPVVLAASDG